MVLALTVLAALVASLVALRHRLLHQESPQRHHEPFDGVVYRVGKAAIAERHCDRPTATVLCMHGFVEDMRYFAQHYRDPSVQLIVLTSCDYHVPVTGPVYREARWIEAPRHPEGSIPYDAAVLVQALEHLPRTRTVRVHGHSRGGAVVLEAAAMRPDLFADVEVVLEAPVLPRGRLYAAMGALQLWAFAFLVPLWRKDPLGERMARGYGALEDPRKRELLAGLPHNPRRIVTMVHNLRDLATWMRERDGSLYRHVRRGTVLVPGKDKVLDARAMADSARLGAPALEVVQLEGCSHFVLLDRPDALPPLRAAGERAAS